MDWFLDRARALGVEHRPPPPMLLGRHMLELGVKPGPRIGEILKAVYEQQLDGVVSTLEEAIGQVEPCSRVRKTRTGGGSGRCCRRRAVRVPPHGGAEIELLQLGADLRPVANRHDEHLVGLDVPARDALPARRHGGSRSGSLA